MPSTLNSIQAGALLIAPPAMLDPNFRRSVVFLCEHNDEGSFGLILNRPLELQLADVLDDVSPFSDPLSLGGPVEPNTLHFLHQYEDVPGCIPVLDSVFWGGDFESIKEIARSGEASSDTLRFFLGYAGWAAEQLAGEAENGGWILATAETESIFPADTTKLWRTVLRGLGGDYAILANFPDDPRLN